MKSLYNKIYKAINEGVIKSLHIDDNNEVSYQHSKINNNFNLINKYVKKFIEAESDHTFGGITKLIESYKHIKELYEENNFTYIINDYYELECLYNGLNNVKGNIPDIIYDWLDFSKIIMIIDDYNNEIPLHLYDNQRSHAAYIKFINTPCGHDIILNAWGEKVKAVYKAPNSVNVINNPNRLKKKTDAVIDYNGFENTYFYQNDNSDKYPAIFDCLQQSNKKYDAYLPAIGEVNFIYKYCKIINRVHPAFPMYMTPYIHKDNKYASSTEYDNNKIWYLCKGKIYHGDNNIDYDIITCYKPHNLSDQKKCNSLYQQYN